MIMDKSNLFSDEQAVTSTAAGAYVVDLGKGDAGPSEAISLVVTAKGYATAAATTVELKTADTVSSGALVSATTVAQYPVTSAAIVAGGKIVSDRLPHGMKRYAGLNYSVGSGGLTSGTMTAGLVWDVVAH
jgi:hypothetical protein